MSSPDLTTVADVKTWLGIADANADAILGRMVSAASSWFYNATARSVLVSAAVTEVKNGADTTEIFPREFPITAVASLTIDGIAIPVSTGPTVAGYTADSGYSIALRGGTSMVGSFSAVPFVFSRGYSNIVYNYTAGYAGGSLELGEIAQAVIELVAQKWARRSHTDQIAQGLGQQSLTFSQKDIPAEVQTVIDRFERLPTW
jgi:hypothetical protein